MKKRIITLFSILIITPCTFFATTSCTFEDIFDHVTEEQKKLDKGKNNDGGEIREENYDFVITPQNVTGDFRTFLQNIVNNYSNILIKNGVYDIELINWRGISPKDNCTITFEKEAKIKVKPNNLEAYSLIDLRGRKNIKLINPNLEGDKYTHLGSKGEWGFGINLTDCSDVIIHNAKITKFWGDGVYMNNCNNIKLYKPHISDNRRQGISIISGNNIEIYDLIVENTGGVSPGYGIDVEPNWNGENVTNLRIYNPIFRGNDKTKNAHPVGFCLSAHKANVINPKKGKLVDSKFDIEIFNPLFEGDMLFVMPHNDYVKGRLIVHNPTFIRSNETAVYFRDHQSDFFETEIKNAKFLDCVQSFERSIYLAPILFYCSRKGVKKTGTKNIRIINPIIEGNKKGNFNDFVAIRNIGTNSFLDDLKDVVISNITIKGYDKIFYNHGGLPSNISDLHPNFSLTVNKKSVLPTPKYDLSVSKNLNGSIVNHTSTINNSTIYIGDDIPISGFEFYYTNNSGDSSPLKLIFGTKERPTQVIVDRWNSEKITGIEIPHGQYVKLKKNKTDNQGIQYWVITESSKSIKNIK
ncbi:right-handed parallel beta-helix repeat-containing protein [Capnocytophaga stomatis]|uniref:right-handed parallel beta-helix repeat-containing protein n=1 Tax=Capnocytophaga stomatis TaxID=1848904 RepID=UPI00385A2DCD